MNATAIILGRGGSKGLPRKNLLDIAGKPCVQWTIDAAKASASVSRVVVSSDDTEMLVLAESSGAVALARPPELASDSARIDDAARHVVRSLIDRGQHNPAHPLVLLYANVPVRPIGCIDLAIARLLDTNCDSVQSYQAVGKYHPWWTARVDGEGVVAPWEGDVLNHGIFRRQDLPPAFVPDGAVIALTTRALLLEISGVAAGPHAFFGKDRRGIVNPEGSVIDIDTRMDLLVAEAMLSQTEPRPSGSGRPRPVTTPQETPKASSAPRPTTSLIPDSAPKHFPYAYLLTFRTYGSWLPGDERGSMRDRNDEPGAPTIPTNAALERHSRSIMKDEPFTITDKECWCVERTLQEVCVHRGWTLWSFAVRSNHVHAVVSADQPPEPIITSFKSWCTRRLNEETLVPMGRSVWASQGSTKYLWDRESMLKACEYVLREQGPL